MPRHAFAQVLPGYDSRQWRIERIGENHIRLIRDVEIERDDWKFYAEEVELFTDTDRLVATGNVVFTSPTNNIAADRVDFNTRTRTGIFYNAAGSASLGERVERSMFGSQEPDAYFYGQTIEKLGPTKYRISRGGFTSCVQPTPRWELTSNTVILNLDDYAILRNAILKVKDVPVFYLPIMYYPIQEDDRATGFLIPAYGSSTIKGQSLSNAFFWAINRSHDATFLHDWFANTGQGLGGEYRYVLGPASQGNARAYFLNERETTVLEPGGGTAGTLVPARRSFELRGGAMHAFGSSVNARGSIDYFSDVTVQQTYHANIYDASRRERRIGGNVSGVWGAYNVSGTVDWNEVFFGDTDSTLTGALPRITISRSEMPIRDWPVYISVGGEVGRLLREGRTETRVRESGLTRLDISPLVRVPFTRWPFLTVNSSIEWRNTYWTESLDVNDDQVDQGISRRYFDLQSRITGPVFVKIWDTPDSQYAERFKHVVEPWVTLQRITAIDNFDRIVQLEGTDSVLGSTTRVGFGLINRFYAKRIQPNGLSVAREIVNVGIEQSYYTDARAAQFDRRFRTSFNGTAPSNLSPVALIVRGSPTEEIDGTLRAEYDTQFGAFRTISADGTLSLGGWLQTTGGWSQRRFIEGLRGFDDPARLDHYLNSATTIRTRGNEVGGVYSFNYDLLRDRYLQQRLLLYYNAQCCGVAVEYQSFNFEGLGSRALVPRDRRFNLSFTLAGVGTFSNFFGALGGGPSTQ